MVCETMNEVAKSARTEALNAFNAASLDTIFSTQMLGGCCTWIASMNCLAWRLLLTVRFPRRTSLKTAWSLPTRRSSRTDAMVGILFLLEIFKREIQGSFDLSKK